MVAHHQHFSTYEHSGYHQHAPLSVASSTETATSSRGGDGYRFHQHHRSAGPSYNHHHHPYQRSNAPASPAQFRHYDYQQQQQQQQHSPVFHSASTSSPPQAYMSSGAPGGAGSFIISSSLSPPPSASTATTEAHALPLKGKRKRASPKQLDTLNKVFASTSFPSTEMRIRLARELGMTPRTVQIWFQNKRQASRQRDGHHSRNTKSLAVYASSDTSISASQDTAVSSLTAASGGSPAPSSRMYGYATHPHYQHSKSTSPPISDYHNNRSSAMVASPSPTQSMPSPAASYSSAHSQQQPTQKPHGSQQQLMVLVEAATTAASTSDATVSESHPNSHKSEFVAVPFRKQPVVDSHSGGCCPDTYRNQYAHTRNDMWFSNAPPPRLDYLYSSSNNSNSNSSVVPKSSYHPQPSSAAAKPMPNQQSHHHSMSLMALLNAPPEQRKLPPLPSMVP